MKSMKSMTNLVLVRWREMNSIDVLRVSAGCIKEDSSYHPRLSHLTIPRHTHVADYRLLAKLLKEVGV